MKLFFRRQVMTRVLLLRGWLLLLARRPDRAEAALDRAVTLAPASFRIRVLRGKVYLAQRRRYKALQEFRICYRLDPSRFMRQPFDGQLQEEVMLEAQVPPESEIFDLSFREDGPFLGEWDDLLTADAEDDGDVIAGTDFRSVAEYRRFQALPPLRPDDVARADLDLLIEQLSAGPRRGETLEG